MSRARSKLAVITHDVMGRRDGSALDFPLMVPLASSRVMASTSFGVEGSSQMKGSVDLVKTSVRKAAVDLKT